ncbi:DNA polymerase I [Collinsella sp. BIOML-A4]|uniref:DNA polymerase I n=1 Tax=unclassified Collinsella TaxID=2637548 RepID=UPI001367D440|nr:MULTISPECIES: DNA polymerase I [unclassified Collinsella]MZJ33428.1 DNA polymerase I [Collinsella sp. BIOML-A1]MZJ27613.1 DNA polymerase I [Collinsella sp. BIOML-A2]MZJ29623.1 DNA polymerase I [Collinsella sp. BIOML-A3]MZJ97196.1 DNA polymerase I [Collinsella sp. BIOML-A6]MZK31024.1 DNA polymerase I [Collinsella sp. BIOML-A5]
MSDKRRTFAVLDGNSLMHRAFHAVPPTMNAPDGRPTNAIFGFLNMFLKMIDAFNPDGVVVAFDKGKPRVRMEMLPQYKAQRPPMDPDLHAQFPMIKELLAALNVPILQSEGWEGDDILGTMARLGEQAGCDMLLVTGDRDMYQLVTEHVNVVSTRKGLSDVAIMTPESVDDLYHGITPALVPDFYGLKGDTSDNIPGVPGIGPKKASALIAQYGSLDEVIAHADEVKGKMGENLRAHIDDALLSRKVATIRTDAPVELDFEATSFPAFSADEVSAALGTLGITAMQNRFLALIGGEGGAAAVSRVFEMPAMVRAAAGDADALGAVAAEVSRAIDAGEWVAAVVDDDKEEGALFGLTRTLWLATSKGLLALEEGDSGAAAEVEGFNFVHGVIAGVLARLFMEGRVASPDMKALLHELSPIDSSEPELMDPLSADSTRIFDTVVAAYLLDSDRSEFDETYLADTYLQMALPAARGTEGVGEDAPAPAARTAALTLALVAPLRDRMARENAANVFDGIEMPLVPVLAKMERAGMLVDPDRLHSLSEGLATQISEVERSIRDLVGDETFNIGSPMQLSHVLFDVLGLPTKGLKKTKRGYYSTNAKVLSDLARDHEIVRLILDWREKSKIKSTYLDTLGPLRRGDGRVHTTYNQTITATGRLSSSDPNLQNIPTRSELGRTVKTAFSAGEGSVFLAVDYSQIELRLLAHLSGDEHLVRAFNEGEDFHAETAARVFGVPVSEVTPDLRSRAKAVNFGIVYGQQAYGLSQSLHISMAEARDMIDRYYEAYPGVRTFLDNVVARAKQTGYAETMYGRRRHIPELKAKNPQLRGFGERTAMNHPMQGTAADIIKIAMARVSRRLEEEGFAAHMILQVHDELDFECPVDEVERLTAMVRDVMEHVVDLRVPLIAEASTGITWADAK